MTSTNYKSTLITVSEECPVERASPPTLPETIAAMQFTLLRDYPYAMTSDELLLAIDRARFGQIDADQWARKSRECLRASPLVNAIHDRVAAASAEILLPLTDKDYGGRDFTFRDPEGHIWSIGSYSPW